MSLENHKLISHQTPINNKYRDNIFQTRYLSYSNTLSPEIKKMMEMDIIRDIANEIMYESKINNVSDFMMPYDLAVNIARHGYYGDSITGVEMPIIEEEKEEIIDDSNLENLNVSNEEIIENSNNAKLDISNKKIIDNSNEEKFNVSDEEIINNDIGVDIIDEKQKSDDNNEIDTKDNSLSSLFKENKDVIIEDKDLDKDITIDKDKESEKTKELIKEIDNQVEEFDGLDILSEISPKEIETDKLSLNEESTEIVDDNLTEKENNNNEDISIEKSNSDLINEIDNTVEEFDGLDILSEISPKEIEIDKLSLDEKSKEIVDDNLTEKENNNNETLHIDLVKKKDHQELPINEILNNGTNNEDNWFNDIKEKEIEKPNESLINEEMNDLDTWGFQDEPTFQKVKTR